MKEVLLWVFVGINLLVRLPIRIAVRFFKVSNDKLDTADLISTIAAGLCFIGLCIALLFSGEIDTAGAVAIMVVFGGPLLLIGGAWVYVKIKEKKK
jgi:hypothetical protein